MAVKAMKKGRINKAIQIRRSKCFFCTFSPDQSELSVLCGTSPRTYLLQCKSLSQEKSGKIQSCHMCLL